MVIALSMSIALVTLLKLHQVSVHLSHSSDPMIDLEYCAALGSTVDEYLIINA